MKYCFGITNVNPIQPSFTIGFEVKKDKSEEAKIALNLRLLRLVDEKHNVVLITIDSLYISYDICQEIKNIVNIYWPDSEVIVSASHTHFAPSLVNQYPLYSVQQEYYLFIKLKLVELIKTLTLQEIDGYFDYHFIPFTQVGSQRIADKDNSVIYAGVISFYASQKRIGSILFYNCHPTIDDEEAKYFSSDYVGYCLKLLQEAYPEEFFMFLQGADGDISTRYTRSGKNYNEVVRLSKILVSCFNDLLKQNQPQQKLTLDFKEEVMELAFEVKKANAIKKLLTSKLSAKEAKELIVGSEMVKQFSKYPNLPTTSMVCISRLSLGSINLRFNPFELFSDYNKMIDISHELLVCYSNGAASYLTPLNNTNITYEYFLETTNEEDKDEFIRKLISL